MMRNRKVKILATLGPASSSIEMIRALVLAGADVFRLNMSHGGKDDMRRRHAAIRTVEQELGRPIGILADLQGPKLRIGALDAPMDLVVGQTLRLDLDPKPGSGARAPLPHREIYAAVSPDRMLLLDDGKIRLRVKKVGRDFLETEVVIGGLLKERKGVNVPDALLPVAALSAKDRSDLDAALDVGVDWVALSFVQRPEDVLEAKKIVRGRAGVMAKIEKPAAVDRLDEILEAADGLMVARGDLGVEMPLERVPGIQKRLITAARIAGKPVVVATQMLESMITAPTPTRAEVSDVATAVFDGADAIMLSAESAAGDYPLEAVSMMNRIAEGVEHESLFGDLVHQTLIQSEHTTADAISAAARQVAETLDAACIVTFTTSGSTALRAARERPLVPVLALTPRLDTARRLCLVWGLNCQTVADIHDFQEMSDRAALCALEAGLAQPGDQIVVTAGVPFGTPGMTNTLRIAFVPG
jgi:pyruvate kinase